MICSSEMKEALTWLKICCKLVLLNVDEFISKDIQKLKVNLSDECDKPRKRKFGQTCKYGNQITIEISRKLWNYYRRTNDSVIGFLFAITISHEIGHAFIRMGGLNKTPKKLRNTFQVEDSGYLIERNLFSDLKLFGGGLTLFALCKYGCAWFPEKAVLVNCRLGSFDKEKHIWTLLPEKYIDDSVKSQNYQSVEPKYSIELAAEPPGNVHIAGRSDEEKSENDDVPSKLIEITDKSPGNVMIERHCIWEEPL
jgi:hypothetical protein